MRFRSRIARLEDRQRRQHRPGEQHFSSVVTVPETIPAEEWHAWLASQPCVCGVVGCGQRKIGLLIPTRAQTAEEWEARYRHKPRPDPVSFPQAELTVILNRIEGEP
jgi:hypothetical protein